MKSFLELPFAGHTEPLILQQDATKFHRRVDKEYIELSVDFLSDLAKGFRTYVNISDHQCLLNNLKDSVKFFPCSNRRKKIIETEFMKIFDVEIPTYSVAAEELYETIGGFLINVEKKANYKELVAKIGFCLILLHNLELKEKNYNIAGFELYIKPYGFYTEPMHRKSPSTESGTSMN